MPNALRVMLCDEIQATALRMDQPAFQPEVFESRSDRGLLLLLRRMAVWEFEQRRLRRIDEGHGRVVSG